MIPREDWSGAENVLAVRLDALGDLLMTTPALRALKEARPGRRITLLTSSAGAEAVPLLPCVDAVIAYEAPWMKAAAPRADAGPDLALIDRLAAAHLDAAVIFTVYSQNPLPAAMVCMLAGIPLRLAHCRENPYQLLTHWVRESEPERVIRHEVRRQIDLVQSVGCTVGDERMALRVPAGHGLAVMNRLRTLGLDATRPWIVIHPGGTAPSRRYPPVLFARAACDLVVDAGMQVVFTGQGSERTDVEEIRSAMKAPSLSLVGELGLADLAALLSLAPLLLANNTGPVHIAAAVGTPVVDLYALTNPQHTPWMVPHRVLNHDVPCKYCYRSICPEGHHDCLRLVPPSAVVDAVQSLLCETGRLSPESSWHARTDTAEPAFTEWTV